MKEIEIIIEKDGEISMDLKGWNGKGCSEVTKEFTKALGTAVNVEKKPDYWKTETKQKQKIRGM